MELLCKSMMMAGEVSVKSKGNELKRTGSEGGRRGNGMKRRSCWLPFRVVSQLKRERERRTLWSYHDKYATLVRVTD
jgi:hypothetical protein